MNEIDFLIHTGDITYFANPGDFSRYFFRDFGWLLSGMAIYAAPGNHDSGWPFVYGPRLKTFRELFPYAYPKEVAGTNNQAHYTVKKGGVRFYFLSYSTGIAPASPQRRWLNRWLKKSDAQFDVVVFGGAQTGHYQRDELLDSLANQGVDLVLNGDGRQPKKGIEYWGEMPVIFVGTAASRPHPLAYIEKHDNYLLAKLIDTTGAVKQSMWMYDQDRQTKVVDLASMSPRIESENGQLKATYQFVEPISTTRVRGIQLVRQQTKQRQNIYTFAYLRPEDASGRAGEGGFRTQYQMFSGSDEVVTMSIPRNNPFKGGPYEIEELTIHFNGVQQMNELAIKEMYLY